MKKLIATASLIGLLFAASTSVQAQAKDEPKPGETMTKKDGAMPMTSSSDMKPAMGKKRGSMMKSMDTDNDGTVSKEEYMAHHEAMFPTWRGVAHERPRSDRVW